MYIFVNVKTLTSCAFTVMHVFATFVTNLCISHTQTVARQLFIVVTFPIHQLLLRSAQLLRLVVAVHESKVTSSQLA